jgi:DNA-binding response OmpR family regulator
MNCTLYNRTAFFTIPGMSTKLLVVDDERDLLELLSMNLGREGYQVLTAETGAGALDIIGKERPDLILLDIMLADISGIKLTKTLKRDPATASIPIILLTAKDTETDIVVGLTVGADDYVTKPFSTSVLTARIEAVLRRGDSKPVEAGEVLQAGPIRINPTTRQAWAENNPVDLTGGEFNILLTLVQSAGKVVPREHLKTALGPTSHGQKDRIVDVHIASLRKKLGPARSRLRTVHRHGYRILI